MVRLGGRAMYLVQKRPVEGASMIKQTNECKHLLSSSHREERLNRAGIELWNLPALGKCMWLTYFIRKPKARFQGPELSSVDPYLGNALGVVWKKNKEIFAP